ncbi:hypothetical protein PROFUN_14523 [Planoprotostelium fungivorum]|uniref:Uncharacterized protein n=1 Tax=Planoprotostelium fungivorum TaxID=1890364 RepID=A0A2P6N6L5_9EUKA|nr:hypothetical protein PROFUN_14523 [Planoprotostelium fungivorum]
MSNSQHYTWICGYATAKNNSRSQFEIEKGKVAPQWDDKPLICDLWSNIPIDLWPACWISVICMNSGILVT